MTLSWSATWNVTLPQAEQVAVSCSKLSRYACSLAAEVFFYNSEFEYKSVAMGFWKLKQWSSIIMGTFLMDVALV
jgi:hypothetical protein